MSSPLYMVVVDETPESRTALRFASLAARAAAARLLLLMILEPATAFRQWLGVETRMQEEARQEAENVLRRMAAEAENYADFTPETLIREGDKMEELAQQIAREKNITTLVLGAGADPEGPGPLVSHIASGGFGVPVMIVPGGLKDRQLRAHIAAQSATIADKSK